MKDEEIINQLILNRNYHFLDDKQVLALKKMLNANKVLCEMLDEKDEELEKLNGGDK